MPAIKSYRYALLGSLAALVACAATPPESSTTAPTPSPTPNTPRPSPTPTPIPTPTPVPTRPPLSHNLDFQSSGNVEFDQWRIDFSHRALADGRQPEVVVAVLDGIEPLETFLQVASSAAGQAEFSKPIWEYVTDTVSPSRKRTGRDRLTTLQGEFDQISAHYGVSKYILAAIWGMETSYGGYIGDFDAPEALASMAFEGRRRTFAESELLALMKIIERGDASREDLLAGWAGAMGQTQFMPSTYYAYAVDWNGDGQKDVWKLDADALASAANYLRASGWRAGEPYIVEVKLPEGFDYVLADGQDRRLSSWKSLGLTLADGSPLLIEDGKFAELFLPATKNGPAWLLFENFNVIKAYNRADSYALSVSLLAENLRGATAPVQAWPTGVANLGTAEVEKLQAGLNSLGYDAGAVDGIPGRGTRAALQKFQKDRGLDADGYPTAAMLALVMAAS